MVPEVHCGPLAANRRIRQAYHSDPPCSPDRLRQLIRWRRFRRRTANFLKRCSGLRAHAGGADQVRGGFALEAVFQGRAAAVKERFRHHARAGAGGQAAKKERWRRGDGRRMARSEAGRDAAHRTHNQDTHLTHGCMAVFRHFSRVLSAPSFGADAKDWRFSPAFRGCGSHSQPSFSVSPASTASSSARSRARRAPGWVAAWISASLVMETRV